MLPSIIILLLLFILNNCTCSNIKIEPLRVLLNTTSKTKLICTKEKDDNRDFEVNLSANISSKYIEVFTNHLNDTAIEIIIQSFDYIGRFDVICSSKGENDRVTYSEITIGKPPGLLVRAEPCIVYYDEYIDCKIRAPVIIQAINNRLKHTFSFVERRLPSQPLVYSRNPELIKIDNINTTLTFRWYPRNPGHFPLQQKMIIYATITDFGATNHTMDMTPIFRISSNFTVPVVSSTDLRIEFPNDKFSIKSLCHGNLTRDDRIHHSNKRENIRAIDEFNLTTIHVSGLRSNTWYRLCFHCRRHQPFRTISDIKCDRYKTLKTFNVPMYLIIIIILVCLLSIVGVILLIVKCDSDRVRQEISQHRHSQGTNDGETMEMVQLVLGPNQRIPQ